MLDFKKLLQELQVSPRITMSSLGDASRQQGAYILRLDSKPLVCLKVGIAGPRRGKGLWERLKFHFSSHPDNTVLARHMAADVTSPWTKGYNFRDRTQRQRFLAEKCYFQTISLSALNRKELEQFEDFLEQELRPKYLGLVVKDDSAVT